MECRLHVGNLSNAITEDDLRVHFAQAGRVESVTLVHDHVTGSPTGFAFIEMETQAEAQNAISLLDGRQLLDRTLEVSMEHQGE
jgi:RNA recognition motif-containing protein